MCCNVRIEYINGYSFLLDSIDVNYYVNWTPSLVVSEN